MNSEMSREKVWEDLLTLPEEAFLAVREFVLFQKSRNGLRGVTQKKAQDRSPVLHSPARRIAKSKRNLTKRNDFHVAKR